MLNVKPHEIPINGDIKITIKIHHKIIVPGSRIQEPKKLKITQITPQGIPDSRGKISLISGSKNDDVELWDGNLWIYLDLDYVLHEMGFKMIDWYDSMEYRNVNLQKSVENPQGNTSGKHQQIMVGDNQSHPWYIYIYTYIYFISKNKSG